MVSRPLTNKPTNEHSDNANTADEQEKKRLSDKFAIHRNLVPLLSHPNPENATIFLNAASAPPSNLIVHEAITRYSHEALYETHPTAKWNQTRETTRRLVARYINAETPETIAFTRDTTEGLGSFMRSVRFERGDNVVVVDTEHPNMPYGWLALREQGLEVRQVVTLGTGKRVEAVGVEDLRGFVDSRTRAVGISSMSFDSGQRHDVAGICAEFRPRGIHVLADITQQVGFATIDVQALGISAGAFSFHKGLNCPTGLGALYISPQAFAELDNPIPPIISMAAAQNIREDLLVKADEPIELYPDTRRFEHANMSLIAVTAAEAYLRFYLDVLGPADVEAHLYNLTDALAKESERLGIPVVGPRERRHRAPHICELGLDREWGAYFKETANVRLTVNRLGVRVSFGFYSSFVDVRRFVEVLEGGLLMGLSVK